MTTLYAHWGPECKHDYIISRIDATCQSPAMLHYSCQLCGCTLELPADDGWGDYVTRIPHGTPEALVRTVTQYRFRCLEETTSAAASMAGWTPGAAVPAWGDYGAWSQWSLTPAQPSDDLQVETAPLYRYHCYRCAKCKARNPWPGACGCSADGSVWQELWSPTPYSLADAAPGSASFMGTSSLGDGEVWFFAAGNADADALGTRDASGEAPVIRLGYRTRTRSRIKLRVFTRCTDWSDWTQTAIATSSRVQAESRTVYQIYTGPLADHTFRDGVCTVCGEKET